MSYRAYVTDGLHEIVGNYKCRWFDIITGNLPEEEEERDPAQVEQEIIQHTMQGGGLQFKE